MTNSDEAKSLLEALQDGSLDFRTVSSALEEDAAREKAKINAEIEKEASRKAAEEKAAAEKAAAENSAADKAAADKAAADKAAADKAAAERAFLKMHKAVPQSLMDDIYENDDGYYEEDDWIGDELEDEIDDAGSLAFPRREPKRSALFDNQGDGRASSRNGRDRAPSTRRWPKEMDRKGPLSLSDDTAEEEEGEWLGDDVDDDIDDGDSLAFPRREQKRSVKFMDSRGGRRSPERRYDDDKEDYAKEQRGKLSLLRTNQKPRHAPLPLPQALTGAHRWAPKGRAGQQRVGVRRVGGGRRGVPLRLP